jgi:hypothetical protein
MPQGNAGAGSSNQQNADSEDEHEYEYDEHETEVSQSRFHTWRIHLIARPTVGNSKLTSSLDILCRS